MHHHHRDVALAVLRDHEPDIHLIDGDVPARTEITQLACVCSTFSPPTKKLPCDCSTSGASGACTSLSDCVSTLEPAPQTVVTATPITMADWQKMEARWLHVRSPVGTRRLRGSPDDLQRFQLLLPAHQQLAVNERRGNPLRPGSALRCG